MAISGKFLIERISTQNRFHVSGGAYEHRKWCFQLQQKQHQIATKWCFPLQSGAFWYQVHNSTKKFRKN